MYRCFFLVLIWVSVFSLSVYAYADSEKDWGIAFGLRVAKTPYKAEDQMVKDFIPLMFYDGDIFFIRGLTGGIKLYDKDSWQFSMLVRYRFLDIPTEHQDRYIDLGQDNVLDAGVQLKYRINHDFETNFELMTDDESRYYSSLNTRYHWEAGSWELYPYATLRYKSSDFNDHYYGLDGFPDPNNPSNTFNNKLGSAFDLTLGSEVRYHVTSNFYLLGRAQLTRLDSDTRDSVTIENGTYGEIYLGLAFFNDKTKKKVSSLKAKPYIRLAHGWGTPSDLNDILVFDWEDDEQNSQITSIFYGHPIADSLLGFDQIDIYITTGYIYHHSAGIYQQTLLPGQGINTAERAVAPENICDGATPCDLTYYGRHSNEYVLGIKAFFNVSRPVHWRFGLANGLSYIEPVSDLEQREMDKKGYRSSNLMNYVDITADFSLGGTFGVAAMNDLFLGVGIHHRSSVFEVSSAFGRIEGGSNFNSVYLQYHW